MHQYLRAILIVLLACLTICPLKQTSASVDDGVRLGPILSPLFEPESVISISTEYQELSYRYGRDYSDWPYEVKEHISNRLLELDHLPDTILFSRVPDQDDLSEAVIHKLAWEGLLHTYPLSEQDKPWYRDNHRIAFGTKDLVTSYWWVHFLPASSTEDPLASSQPMDLFTVQIDRNGSVVDVIRTGSTGVHPTTNPLTLLFTYMNETIFSDLEPMHTMTHEEKLDLNIFSLFPHMGAIRETYGLPREGDLSGTEALSLAKDHIRLIGGIDGESLNDAVADVSYFIGEIRGYTIRPQTAYPLWHIRFTESTGSFLCSISVHPVTGEILEYKVRELGYIPLRW